MPRGAAEAPREGASEGPAGLEGLVRGVRERRGRALGRAISRVEDGGPEVAPLMAALYPETGRARLVGITGPPGAGKSTLVEALARALRQRDQTVAVLAVDPTSPFTGGALLGDRVRMQALATDPGVFIRSMATRGSLGGLAAGAHDAVDLLDAAGFDWILVETVGVGQDEVDVVASVDSVVVVTVPGLGDEVQAGKAGLFEIGDLFVVNKADRPGADRAVQDLEMMLHMGLPEGGSPDPDAWAPPVLRTVAPEGEGLEALLEGLEAHRCWLAEDDRLAERRKGRLRLRTRALLEARLLAALARAGFEPRLDEALAERIDPHRLSDQLYRDLLGDDP